MKTDTILAGAVWLGFALHLLAALAALRHWTTAPAVATANFLFGLAILSYWGVRWFGYLFRGVTWYVADQALPAYALAVCVVAGLALFSRFPSITANWVILALDGLALLAAGMFFTFFRITRLT